MTLSAALRLTAAALIATAAPIAAQSQLALDVRNGAPLITVRNALDDDALESAVRSGLPLRMRFRVELWMERLFDVLEAEAAWTAIVAFEPLDGVFLVGQLGADSVESHPDWMSAVAAVERTYAPDLAPARQGRHYYIAVLEIETLSLSDLDELERWLRGDLEPAVRGVESVGGAVGTGLKRLLIRVLGLPARRYEARSRRFVAQ